MNNKMMIAVLILSVVAAAACAGEKITLKQKYPPGTYIMTQDTRMQTTTEMGPGQTMAQKVNMLMVMEMTVGKPDQKGSKKMQIAYKRIKQSVEGPVSMSYDSEAPKDSQNPMLAGVYEALLQTRIEATITPEGKVTDVKGFEKMWEELTKSNPAAAPMMKGFKKQFGDEMMEKMFSQSKQMLPDKPVGKGDTWDANLKLEIPMLGRMDIKQKCKLKEIEKTAAGKIAVIDFTGTVTGGAPGKTTTMGTATMTFKKMDTEQSGTMRMDVDTGMMTRTMMNQKMAMEMSVTGPDGGQMNMATKMAGTSEVTVAPGKYVRAAATKPAKVKP